MHPLDIQSATEVVNGAYAQFTECAMAIDPVALATTMLIGKEEAMRTSLVARSRTWTHEVMDGVHIFFGLVLLFASFSFVRPINFCAGRYLGGSFSLLVLTLFAPVPTPCMIVFGMPTFFALLVGTAFVYRRGSLFAMFGLVVGEIVGRLVYDLLLGPLGAPDFLAYSCIGFFSVVLAGFMWQIGDAAWVVCCSLVGAYYVVLGIIQLAVPILVWSMPIMANLDAFVQFRPPDMASAGNMAYEKMYWKTVVSNPYIFVPLLVVLLLTVVGSRTQLRLMARAELTKSSEAAALVMK